VCSVFAINYLAKNAAELKETKAWKELRNVDSNVLCQVVNLLIGEKVDEPTALEVHTEFMKLGKAECCHGTKKVLLEMLESARN